MKVNFFPGSFFPFAVPEKDGSFAASVGPGTAYPAGFSLDQVMQIYWRSKDYTLAATGTGTNGEVSQSLAVSGPLPPRNVAVGTNAYGPLTGFLPTGPADLVTGCGLRQSLAGGGTITASGELGAGTNPDAAFAVQVNLFYPGAFVPDPVVKFGGLWWPALGLDCDVTNTVLLDTGGGLAIRFNATTQPEDGTAVEIGSFSFFGAAVPVYSRPLDPGDAFTPPETRSFSGSLSVAAEWP